MSGELDKISGKVKEVVGDVSGNAKLEAEGLIQQGVGKVKEVVGNIEEKGSDVLQKGKEEAEHLVDEAKEKAESLINDIKRKLQYLKNKRPSERFFRRPLFYGFKV